MVKDLSIILDKHIMLGFSKRRKYSQNVPLLYKTKSIHLSQTKLILQVIVGIWKNRNLIHEYGTSGFQNIDNNIQESR